jgi:uncharacterized protein (TIGR02466 family)
MIGSPCRAGRRTARGNSRVRQNPPSSPGLQPTKRNGILRGAGSGRTTAPTGHPMIEFESFKTQGFFPTFVWVMDLKAETAEPLNRQIIHDLNALTAPRPKIRPGQNWQTEQNLHEFEEFATLVEIFKDASGKVLDILEVDYDSFAITGCWANMNPKGSFHMPHSHPNNYLSGVYYAQTQPGADKISFHDPRTQLEIIAPRVKNDNIYNSTLQSLAIKPGRLVVFPAWFIHSVIANTSDQVRISISFNIMFSSFAETMSQPKWSGIPLRRK